MSNSASERNKLVVPGVAALVLALIVGLFWLTRGDDSEPESTPAPTPTASPTSNAITERLEASGDAPEAIALGDVTIARSTSRLGLAADVPEIDLEEFDEVLLTVVQGDDTWLLSSVRDPRGTFLVPQLYLDEAGERVQYFCGDTALRVRSTRLTLSMPLSCLDEPKAGLTATFSISDQEGGVETTSESGNLKAPKK